MIVLAVALMAGALAAYLASGIMMNKTPQAVVEAPKPETIEVLLAAEDLHPGEKLTSGVLEWRPWPRDSASNLITREARPDAVEAFATARARQPIYAGEPIIDRKVVSAGNGSFMSAILPQGMRAISVAISEHSAVSGFILPNDRVDVIVTRQYDVNQRNMQGLVKQKQALTETVLSNVRVLAINQTFRQDGDDKVTVPEGRTAVLELDPDQTEIIIKAETLGELSLALRSVAEGGVAGLQDAKPELSGVYRNKPKSTGEGPLVIRFGVETTVANP